MDPLELAKTYPYAPPRHSYLYVNGVVLALVRIGDDPTWDGEVDLDGRPLPAGEALRALGITEVAPLRERVPVLAYGSNAAPTQLARKFSGFDDVVIPVVRAELGGYDVVYSAHFSRYGAIPATLAASPPTAVETAVAYLTEAQLARLHETELEPPGTSSGNYVFEQLSSPIVLDGGAVCDGAGVYLSRFGALGLTGAPLALAQMTARDRRFEALDEIAALELVRTDLAPHLALDDLLQAMIADSDERRIYNERLVRSALDLRPRPDRR